MTLRRISKSIKKTHQQRLSNAILSTTIVPIFGLLVNSKLKEEEDCHTCYEKITKKLAFVIETRCCGHLTHTECFQSWAESSLNAMTIRCAYCRTEYDHRNRCFLCLNKIEDKKDVKCTNCCHSKVHTECVKELKDLLTMLVFEHTIECGQLNHCRCLWVHV